MVKKLNYTGLLDHEDGSTVIVLNVGGTTRPKTQGHIPEDLNFSNTAVRTSNFVVHKVR
jgi:hypothetical protein